MKTVLLVRHAKSSWKNEEQKDFDRPLNERGHNDAAAMAARLFDTKFEIDAFISSPAKRAYETAKIMANSWIINVEKIELCNDLYTFDSNKLEQFIKSCSNDYNNLILFGHNSAITDFVNKFGDIYIDNVPTSGFVSIIFESNSWETINKGIINKIIFPRDV